MLLTFTIQCVCVYKFMTTMLMTHTQLTQTKNTREKKIQIFLLLLRAASVSISYFLSSEEFRVRKRNAKFIRNLESSWSRTWSVNSQKKSYGQSRERFFQYTKKFVSSLHAHNHIQCDIIMTSLCILTRQFDRHESESQAGTFTFYPHWFNC